MRKNRTLLTDRQRRWWSGCDRFDDILDNIIFAPVVCLLLPITLPLEIIISIIQRIVFRAGLRILKFIERNSIEYLTEYAEAFKLEEESRRYEAEKLARSTDSLE